MSFASILLQWFSEHGRELPWRATKDPYAVWLSEIILQQTRVNQGWSYWEKIMHQWSTVEQLADASEDDVLKAWQGLGYYSRARNLHKAAQQVKALGKFPNNYQALKQLKGVGDYTAAAIASISFNEPVAVVDGNVYRVLSRYFGIDTPIDTTAGKKEFAALAQELIALDKPGIYNQAIMDFGAIQCTPASPNCSRCLLLETCVAFRLGHVGSLPVKSKKIKQRERRFDYVYIKYNDEIAIHQRGAGDIWQGLWELPQVSIIPKEVQSKFSEISTKICSNVKHILTHQIIYADLHLWVANVKPALPSDYLWVKTGEISNYALPRLIELLLVKLPNEDI